MHAHTTTHTHTHTHKHPAADTIGGIPIDDHWGKEVITRYDAPTLATAATWYSDSNVRDSVKRVRNFRPVRNVAGRRRW